MGPVHAKHQCTPTKDALATTLETQGFVAGLAKDNTAQAANQEVHPGAHLATVQTNKKTMIMKAQANMK